MNYRRHILHLLLLLLCCSNSSCIQDVAPNVSFYYWKTKYALNTEEQKALEQNKVQQLYIRYFDIEYNKTSHKAQPVGIIQFNGNKPHQKIIPVIYIKNEVFEAANDIDSLCGNVYRLTTQINAVIHQNQESIQFDCDWTLRTKDAYFHFLRTYKALSKKQISATIRLHQIKYRLMSGVPPIDRGVLMFYNMGKIDASENNSIFDDKIAATYLGQLKNYPLPLDIALPIFSWGIQIRNGKVIQLLNKMNDDHFHKDIAFQKIREHRYKVVQACFKGGYYFQQNDEVKIETVPREQLIKMPTLLQKQMPQRIQQIIFYDLDDFNLKNYDADIYQKVANSFH